jgi:2-methylcitrate dehydratase
MNVKAGDADMEDTKKHPTQNDSVSPTNTGVARRDVMKLGAGAMLASLGGKAVGAQEGRPARTKAEDSNMEGVVRAAAGWKNDSNRLNGNGPMDETSRYIVNWVHSFSEAQLTESVLTSMNSWVIDTLAAWISGFETEQARIGARLGKMTQCEMKSTILGYGIVTAPQIAGMTNAVMTRHKDFNDMQPASHGSVNVPGIISVGEALHSSGIQALMAMAIAMEVITALQGAVRGEGRVEGGEVAAHFDNLYNGVASALAAGKLMGFDEDRLANALSMALVPHIPMSSSHVGHLSHYKSMHQAIAVHDGIWAAMMAREGMTGPCAPFESRNGLWDSVTGPFNNFHLPAKANTLAVTEAVTKRFPSDGDHQALLSTGIPAIRQMVKAEDIAAIDFEVPWGHWQENADPPKWDPHNSETADHSMPYCMAVALISGDIYLNDYKPKRYLEDKQVRDLMEKITTRGNSKFQFHQARITVTRKNGEVFTKEINEYKNPTAEERLAKYKKVCAYMSISDEQRDKALATWQNLQNVHDVGQAVQLLAHFGKPRPLNEKA